MKNKIKNIVRKIIYGPLAGVSSIIYQGVAFVEYYFFQAKWRIMRYHKPDEETVQRMCENATIIFKSFERQKMAKRLYKNIQSYYPGIKVIIADDSRKPLDLVDDSLEVIQLPFNSGLSYGLNRALEKVSTPFVIRMDDDELLTPFTQFDRQLKFLMNHSEIDLAAVQLCTFPRCLSAEKLAREYFTQPMNYAPKPLKIPHLTRIDDVHVVVGKAPNTFIGRTEKIREIGYDNHIRMIDHNDFFFRAAGNLVSVMDVSAFVFHAHNRFNKNYQKYRTDVYGDRKYIWSKYYQK